MKNVKLRLVSGLLVAALLLTGCVESSPVFDDSDSGDSENIGCYDNSDTGNNDVTEQHTDTGAVELTPIFEDFIEFDPETVGVDVRWVTRFEKDGWIYYEKYNDHIFGGSYDSQLEYTNSLFRARLDGTDEMQITSNQSVMFFIVGEWIYYKNGTYTNGTINKVRLDGTDDTVISDENLMIEAVHNGWIYGLCSNSDDFELYKIRTDGTDLTQLTLPQLTVNGMFSFYPNGNWIFYSSECDNGISSIYRIRTDGTNNTKIFETKDFSIFLEEITREWIYFSDIENDGETLWEIRYRVRHDGTGVVEVERKEY